MKRLLCRGYQAVLRVAAYAMPWREPILLQGKDSLRKLPDFIRQEGLARVLIVTDAGLMKLQLLEPLFQALSEAEIAYAVYDQTVANPTIDNVEAAVSLYRQNGCQGVIAFGGGSPMDCAKACAARISNPRKSVAQLKGLLRVTHKLPPLYAVPTTAGTGSETTIAAVITDTATHHKYAINDPALIPHAAVLDPSLTLKLPAGITATTGMDALCHAIEAYIGRSNTRRTKECARQALRLIFDHLERCYQDGSNYEARANMQHAAYLAGLAFTRAYVGYIHAIAHTLGGQYGVAHGLANAVIMPYVLRYYGQSAWKPLAELADVLGLAPTGTSEQKANALIAAIEDLNRRMNIPSSLPQIQEEDIPHLADFAAQEGNWLYPSPKVLLRPELEMLFRQIRQPESTTQSAL